MALPLPFVKLKEGDDVSCIVSQPIDPFYRVFHQLLSLILAVPLSARFCLGRWDIGRISKPAIWGNQVNPTEVRELMERLVHNLHNDTHPAASDNVAELGPLTAHSRSALTAELETTVRAGGRENTTVPALLCFPRLRTSCDDEIREICNCC